MPELKRKYGLAIKVLAIVAVLVAVKIILNTWGFQYINITPLFATIVGGALFLTGFILAGTLADYKESEKIPSEIAASLESILQEGQFVKKINSKFDLVAHRKRLSDLIVSFKDDLKNKGKTKKSLQYVSDISESMVEMEKLGIPAGYIARIKSEQSNLNKNMLRAFQIKETSFVPAAYAIVEIISAFMVFGLILLKLEPFIESLTVLSIIVYIFIYMILFIRDLDDPFEGNGGYADVDLFLLDEFEKKVKP